MVKVQIKSNHSKSQNKNCDIENLPFIIWTCLTSHHKITQPSIVYVNNGLRLPTLIFIPIYIFKNWKFSKYTYTNHRKLNQLLGKLGHSLQLFHIPEYYCCNIPIVLYIAAIKFEIPTYSWDDILLPGMLCTLLIYYKKNYGILDTKWILLVKGV